MASDEASEEYPHEQPLPENLLFHPERAGMDLPVVDILRTAFKADLEACVIIGRRKSGREFFACSDAHLPEVVYMLQRANHFVHLAADDTQADIVGDDPIPTK